MVVRLPVDDILPEALAALGDRATRSIVVEAPPGAGKTTRLPPAIFGCAGFSGKVYVTEPRRVAARLSAKRVAEELDEPVGKRVGYQVRFEDKTGPETRLFYATEGLLLRRLLSDQHWLDGQVIVLDEVHERSADMDTILALLKHAQAQGANFKLVAMSATLDAERLVEYLGPDTRRFVSAGRTYPVSVSYDKSPDDRPLSVRVRSAVKAAKQREGDILVFLPGAAEIRACGDALRAVDDLLVQTMHGDMPLSEQAKVVAPHRGAQRVVLATNIAESSLTIVGVTTAIDSGLSRTAHFDPWSTVSRLKTSEISQARAIQRAGRAGRVSPGHAIRLYTNGQFSTRPPQDIPELLRTDLSELYLRLCIHHEQGGPAPTSLRFLDEPSETSWAQARKLLSTVQALEDGKLTDTGRQMSLFSVTPRLARCIVEGHRRGVIARTCIAAALLSERDVMVSSRHGQFAPDVETVDSDLEERIERLVQLADGRFSSKLARDVDLDMTTARRVDQLARALFGQARSGLDPSLPENPYHLVERETDDESTTRAMLPGFVDRVAERRGDDRQLLLQTGVQAMLSHHSGVMTPLLLALSMDAPGGRDRKPVVRLAARIDPDWLLDLDGEVLTATDDYSFDAKLERVELSSRLCFGKLVLDESRSAAPANEQSERVLARALMETGETTFDPEGQLSEARLRLLQLVEHCPELFSDHPPELTSQIKELAQSDTALRARAVETLVRGATRIDQVRSQSPTDALFSLLPHELLHALERCTPKEVELGGGLRVKVHYQEGRPPWIQARLQNFFSMTKTPCICMDRVPLQVHLLAPNHRAVQVTSDLQGFWQRHYPDLRKQLMRRYPKHLWPEDGTTALPPTPGRIR